MTCTTMSGVKKDDRIELRISTELKKQVQAAATADKRKLTQWVEIAIEEKLARDEQSRQPKS